MVDSISSSGPFQNTPVQNVQGQAPVAKPAGAPPPGAASSADSSSGAHKAQSVDLSGFVTDDLTNDQALAQSQTAGQQLSGTGLAIANRAPQALYNALSG